MSTSALRCPDCGLQLATQTKSKVLNVVDGVRVRLRPHSAVLTCPCGCTYVVTYPRPKAKAA